jgi:predicted CXXCH cytochrome family protein
MRHQHVARFLQTIVVATALVGLSTAAFGQIQGTGHDLSSLTGASAEICVVCHTPHDADQTVAAAPLWNHTVTGASFTLYSSDTLDSAPSQPDGVSKLCLSCHDGTVAVDAFPGGLGTTTIAVGFQVGLDLRYDHPISMVYDEVADPGLVDPATASGLPGGGSIDNDMLFATKVQCASCHDAHDGAGLGAGGNFLVMSNDSSALCLTCHDK